MFCFVVVEIFGHTYDFHFSKSFSVLVQNHRFVSYTFKEMIIFNMNLLRIDHLQPNNNTIIIYNHIFVNMKTLPKKFGDLVVKKRISSGHTSQVLLASYKDIPKVACKAIKKKDHENAIKKEAALMGQLQGIPHIPNLIGIIETRKYSFFIIEYYQGIKKSEFVSKINLFYMQKMLLFLLETLRIIHTMKIVHRDIKFNNLLILEDFSDVFLIDWGSGKNVDHKMRSTPGTQYTRSPDMLLGNRKYECSCDIWATGVLIYTILCNFKMPWYVKPTLKMIEIQIDYFGGKKFIRILKRLKLKLTDEVCALLVGHSEPTKKLEDEFDPEMKQKNLDDPDLVDLMKKLMEPDPTERISADEALHHPFFMKEIKEE
ncbi:CAMK family protein kinase [Tritrichomonas foetus]|uniref:non-specific serine/threonine protein kinase n=1 Tax=Tritrichomonas foetus TaxID=1144522 RepID=A0A1J4JEH3_9EUKA|nr:CAMK family protein kinase [Tritrichomonas foetus]|eukprot:OHS96695.1 CAMK family protein kinase [Tritrichomonas foetus]